MATRPQQLLIMEGMRDKIDRALKLARIYQQGTVELEPDNPDTSVTITGAQQAGLVATFDSLVAGVKSDGATL
jgi:hypothetical protein